MRPGIGIPQNEIALIREGEVLPDEYNISAGDNITIGRASTDATDRANYLNQYIQQSKRTFNFLDDI